MKDLEFVNCKMDECLFYRRTGGGIVYVAVFVDDLVVAGSDLAGVELFKREISRRVEIKDLGALTWCLGMKVDQDLAGGTVRVSQSLFIDDLLKKADMVSARPSAVPATPDVVLSRRMCPVSAEELSEMAEPPYAQYRSLVGSVMYLAVCTRPDISFAVSQLSRVMDNPGRVHWAELLVLLRYLNGSREKGIMYRREHVDTGRVANEADRVHIRRLAKSMGSQVVAFSDADFARDVDERKSVSGFIVYLNGGPVAWRSKLQKSVATSTMDAEIFGVSECCKATIYVIRLLEEIGIAQLEPVALYTDNQACQTVMKNGGYPPRAKHIDVRHFFIQQMVQDRLMNVFYCPTHYMPADVLTKPLAAPTLQRLDPYVRGWWDFVGGVFMLAPTGGAFGSGVGRRSRR